MIMNQMKAISDYSNFINMSKLPILPTTSLTKGQIINFLQKKKHHCLNSKNTKVYQFNRKVYQM